MIEKMEKFVAVSRQQISTPELVDCLNLLINKINELVDYVNALIESNNIHEKQIDELQMKVEPEKLTGFAKTLSDLDMLKSMSTYTNKGAK